MGAMLVSRVGRASIAAIGTALAVLAACTGNNNGGQGGSACTAPFVSNACDSCASANCGGALNTLCPGVSGNTGCYCSCVAGGGNEAGCASSCTQSNCTPASVCNVASCLVRSCSSACGVTSSLAAGCPGGSSSGSSGGTTCTKNAANGSIAGAGYDITFTNAPVRITLMQASPPLFTFFAQGDSKDGSATGPAGVLVFNAVLNLDGSGLDASGAGTFTLGGASPDDSSGDITFSDTNGTAITTLATATGSQPAGTYTLTIKGSAPAQGCGGAIAGATYPMTGGSLNGTMLDGNKNAAALSLTW